MKSNRTIFQIGKNGLTSGVIHSLEQDLKAHSQVRISVLKAATRDREEINSLANKIQDALPMRCSFRIIGFTIVLKKLSNKKKT